MTVGELQVILANLDPGLEVKMEQTGDPAVYVAGVLASPPWVKFVQCDHPMINLCEPGAAQRHRDYCKSDDPGSCPGGCW